MLAGAGAPSTSRAADLLADADRRVDASVTTADAAGNATTATTTRNYLVNFPPVANADALLATEDTAATYGAAQLLGNDSDADGNALSIASVTSGTGGTAVLNGDGTVTFTPNADFNGTADFSYTVTDGTLVSSATTVTVSVAAVNDLPITTDATAGTGENTVLASSVPAATDVDGTIASYALLSGPASGSLTFKPDGTYSFNPGAAFDDLAAGATRQVSFTYTATDNNGGVSAPATVAITVTGTDLPIASNALAGTGENAVLASSVPAGSDVDGTVTSYSLVTGPASGSLTFNPDGTYSFNPGAAFDDLAVGATRDVSFTYTATDNNGGVSTPATVTITVTGTNDLPIASDTTAGTGGKPMIPCLERARRNRCRRAPSPATLSSRARPAAR